MIVRARAPLRLGFAGGGTDVSPYCDLFGGQVMNATIDRYAYASIDQSPSGKVEFIALDGCISELVECDAILGDGGGELQLLKGVYRRISCDFLGGRAEPLRLRTYSDAPPGSGLGASSTLVVALVSAFTEYYKLPLGEYEIGHLAYEIEREDLGLSGGRQDQYAAAFGGFNFMEFNDGGHVIVNPLRIKPWVLAELEASLVLYFTGVSRASADIIDEQTRNVEQSDQSSIDAMHQLKIEAVQMKEALLRGDLPRFARTLQAGWEAKKRMAHCITNPTIDRIEAVAFGSGAIAAKVSGAGGGGFMMFQCAPEDRLTLRRALANEGGS
ncbi:MAG: dehydrogenase, partial [Xanthomonadaceae bacterium]|nr:dehydrogenase [Xanthomonadaceae bacterium]